MITVSEPRTWRDLQVGVAIPDAVLDAHGYREFLDAALERGDRVTEEFKTALRLGGAPGY